VRHEVATSNQNGNEVVQEVISREELIAYCKAADELAADRTTKGLPVVVAQLIFAFSYAISYYQTSSAPMGPGNWETIEIYSIGKLTEHLRM
jgi:hypothetical protein